MGEYAILVLYEEVGKHFFFAHPAEKGGCKSKYDQINTDFLQDRGSFIFAETNCVNTLTLALLEITLSSENTPCSRPVGRL